jgi:hypothetical protein
MISNTIKGDNAVKTNPVVNRMVRRTSALESPQQVTPTVDAAAPAIDFHGASIINETGDEIPITETMVQQACRIYIKQWEMAHKIAAND